MEFKKSEDQFGGIVGVTQEKIYKLFPKTDSWDDFKNTGNDEIQLLFKTLVKKYVEGFEIVFSSDPVDGETQTEELDKMHRFDLVLLFIKSLEEEFKSAKPTLNIIKQNYENFEKWTLPEVNDVKK